MELTLDRAAIGTGLAAPVPPLTLSAGPGLPSFVTVETAERPLLVSMLAGGRLHPDSGAVLIDGAADSDALRLATALVDTPVVAEPSPGVSLMGVVAEEFSFAGLPSSRGRVRAFLAEHGLAEYSRLPVRALPAADRVRLFCELALLRSGIGALVVTSPERHGGEPAEWFAALDGIAARGVTVLIVTDAATADALTGLGARDSTTAPESRS
ncbi:hypothetical protein BH11ACT4_BH11ACT4_07140 [soil metagenome]